jgi:hypothetical protein
MGFRPAADDESRFRRQFAATKSQQNPAPARTKRNALIGRQNLPESSQAGFGHFS